MVFVEMIPKNQILHHDISNLKIRWFNKELQKEKSKLNVWPKFKKKLKINIRQWFWSRKSEAL